MGSVSWIKLKTNMFDDEKIQLIEALPEADTILVIWLKLLIQAGKTNENGEILLSKNIPYSLEMLSTIFRRKPESLRFALKTLEKFELIEVTESNVINIKNWEKHQNIEGLDKVRESNRLRQAKFREKQKEQKATKEAENKESVMLHNVTVTEQNKNKNKSENKKKNKTYMSDSNEYRLSELLFNQILIKNPQHKKPNLQSWAKHIDLMIRIDKRSPEDIEGAIHYIQKHSSGNGFFWGNVILSTSKLREKFDKIIISKKHEANNGNGQGVTEDFLRELHESIKNDPDLK